MGVIQLILRLLQPLIIFNILVSGIVLLWGARISTTAGRPSVGKWLVGALCLIIGLSIGIPLLLAGAFFFIGSLVSIGRDATGLGWIFVFFILPPGLGISALLIPAVRLLGVNVKHLIFPVVLIVCFQILYLRIAGTNAKKQQQSQQTVFE